MKCFYDFKSMFIYFTLLLVYFLTLIPLNLYGAGGISLWTRTYGSSESDRGYSVKQTSDRGYIITGYTNSYGAGGYDVYLVKTDSIGDTLWTKAYGGSSHDYGKSVQQTNDGGYIITGYTDSYGAGGYDVYLIKTDANGDTLWTKTYGGTSDDYGYSVQQTNDGGYIIAGYTNSFSDSNDVYLIKTGSNGDTLWTKTYGENSHAYGYSVQQTSDGGYIITGDSYASPYLPDVYLIKTDSIGDTLWTKAYGGSSHDYGKSVRQTNDGGYIITGYTDSYGAGGYDVYLIKTDANGDMLWTKTYGGTSDDKGYSVQQTNDGGYIITGYTNSYGAGNWDVYLIKTNSNGDTLWTRTYGGGALDAGNSVQQTSDGGYITTGFTYSYGAGNDDVYLIKVNVNDFNIIQPDGGEYVNGGETYNIIWNKIPTPESLYIYYSTDSGATYTNLIVKMYNTSEDDTTFTWNVPNINCKSARIKVVAFLHSESTFSAISDSVFTIDTDFPTSFSLVSPAHLDTTNTTPVFEWHKSYDSTAGLSHYEIYVDNNLFKISPDTFFKPDFDDRLTTGWHTWYVKSVDNAGHKTSSDDSFFIYTKSFHLLYPPDSSWTNQSNPTFSWDAFDPPAGVNLIKYQLLINNNIDRDSIPPSDTTITSFAYLGNGTYSWYVRAITDDSTEWSSIELRTIRMDETVPDSFGLISPVDSATTDTMPAFVWHSSFDGLSGIEKYELWIDDSLMVDNIHDTTCSSADIKTEGIHTWYMVAVDSAGNEKQSSDTNTIIVDTQVPVVPMLIAPDNGVTTNDPLPHPITFIWGKVAKELLYKGKRNGINDNRGSLVRYNLELINGSDTMVHDSLTDTTITLMMSSEGNYKWHVEAFDEAGYYSGYSGYYTFVIDTTSPNSFDLILPLDNANTDTMPTFVWHSSFDGLSGIKKYELWIDGSLKVDNIHDTTCSSANIQTEGTHTWYIVTEDSSGNRRQSNQTRTINVDTQAPNVPVLISPLNGACFNNALPAWVNLTWSTVSKNLFYKGVSKLWKNTEDIRGSAVKYRLRMINGSDTTVHDSLTDTTYTFITTSEGENKWQVEAFDEAGYTSGYTNLYTFYMDTTSPSTFDLILPSDSAITDSLPIFIWHPSTDTLAGIGEYELWINGVLNRDSITDTMCIPKNSLNDGIYNWYIVAVDKAGNRRQSNQTRTVIVDLYAPQTPTLISPEDSSILSSTSQILMWGSVSKAYAKVPHKGNIKDDNRGSLVRYNLEFINGSDTTVYDSLTDTTLTLNMLSEGNYNWHVQAFDEAGYYSPYSGYYTFAIDTTAPAITNTTVLNDTVSPGPFAIYSKITDNKGVDTVKLWYKTSLDTVWTNVNMSFTGDSSTYTGEIPAQIHGDTIWYYVEAKDISSPANMTTDPSGAPANSYSFVCSITGIAESKVNKPVSYFIKTARSSLTGSNVTIEYGLPKNGDVELTIYGLTGRKIVTLAKGFRGAGIYSVRWNGRNRNGVAVKRGIYIAEFKSGDIRKALKIVNIK